MNTAQDVSGGMLLIIVFFVRYARVSNDTHGSRQQKIDGHIYDRGMETKRYGMGYNQDVERYGRTVSGGDGICENAVACLQAFSCFLNCIAEYMARLDVHMDTCLGLVQ